MTKKSTPAHARNQGLQKGSRKRSQEGLTIKKGENFSEWYTQIIQKAEMIDYTKVSGAIVLKPNAYYVWEKIQEHFNKTIKKLGVKNVCFPSLIPENLLKKEKEHVEGFTPEVAWVTHAGTSKLKERLAIRPTSETIIYDSYKKWIRSYKDLPLKLNQWCNVVRWEFKHPIPFLRTREFLWQEGHSVFSSKKEADEEVMKILDIYANIFEDLLAVPVLKGKKTNKEKFAGALYTMSVETPLPNGKAVQGATSHNLGQNFAKAFDITFLDKNEKKQYAWQTSWGLSTRSIGIMVALHGDDKGLILPPKIAPIQIVIIPIIFEKSKGSVLKKAKEIKNKLSNYEVYLDDRDYSSGWKFNEWELKGVPIRIEIGPNDIKKNQAVMVRRDNRKKIIIKIKDLSKKIDAELESMQNDLFKKANKLLQANLDKAENLKDTIKKIKKKKIVLVPLKNSKEIEDILKEKLQGAKTLNIPLKQPPIKGKKCIISGEPPDYWVYVGRSY